MPAPDRLRDLVGNALLGVVATIAVAVLTGVWGSKENVTAHQTDMAAIRRSLDSIAAAQTRILDALCNPDAVRRVCSSK